MRYVNKQFMYKKILFHVGQNVRDIFRILCKRTVDAAHLILPSEHAIVNLIKIIIFRSIREYLCESKNGLTDRRTEKSY